MHKTAGKQGAPGGEYPRANDLTRMINQLSALGYDVVVAKNTLASGLITVKAYPPDKDTRK
jgi:hypothetical protein